MTYSKSFKRVQIFESQLALRNQEAFSENRQCLPHKITCSATVALVSRLAQGQHLPLQTLLLRV